LFLGKSLSRIIFYSLSFPKEKLKKYLFWNGSFALFHSQAPPLMIAAIINISDLNYDMPINYASSVISIVIIVTIAILTGIEI
jgi:hypothetical protein